VSVARTRAELCTRTLLAARRSVERASISRGTQAALESSARRASAPGLMEVRMFGRRLVTPHQAQVLAERARFMRSSPTRGEEWLWRELSGSKTGIAFRRQLVIGHHIVDVACTKVRLAVEVDGDAHLARQHLDAALDRALRALGWLVLRVTEDDVVSDLHLVLQRIVAAASALRGSRPEACGSRDRGCSVGSRASTGAAAARACSRAAR